MGRTMRVGSTMMRGKRWNSRMVQEVRTEREKEMAVLGEGHLSAIPQVSSSRGDGISAAILQLDKPHR